MFCQILKDGGVDVLDTAREGDGAAISHKVAPDVRPLERQGKGQIQLTGHRRVPLPSLSVDELKDVAVDPAGATSGEVREALQAVRCL
jgi:hypothetical protein